MSQPLNPPPNKGKGPAMPIPPAIKKEASDTTLGGVQKKTFVPTVPVRRKKEDAPAKPEGADGAPKKAAAPTGNLLEKPGMGRGRGMRPRKELKQTMGSFSMGPADRLRAGPSFGGTSYVAFGGGGGGDRDSGSGSGSGSGAGRGRGSGSKAASARAVRAGRERQTEDMEDDSNGIVGDNQPTTLPLAGQRKRKAPSSVKPEPMDEGHGDGAQGADRIAAEAAEQRRDEEKQAPTQPSEILLEALQRDLETLLFMQFPDVLPYVVADRGQQPNAAAPADQQQQQQQQQQRDSQAGGGDASAADAWPPFTNTMRDMKDGLLGKIVVRRSGKTTLQIGHVSLNISSGTPCGFLQEAVAVSPEFKQCIVLGRVGHRLLVTPDVDTMLESAALDVGH